jgi:glycosyltransferase involved in cell wall biosynthesis
VIATYQAASTVAEAVESALGQSAPPAELLVVDDGSTDGTEQALRPYRRAITYIRQANRGAAAAKNVGFRRAAGEFVAILDADDVYEPDALAALTELAVSRPDLNILQVDLYFEVGGEIVGRFSEKTPFPIENQNLAIIESCFLAEPAVRRSAMIAIGGFDESLRIAHDWECWIRLLHAGSAAGFVDEPLLRYRVGDTGLTANRVASLRERVSVLERASLLDLSRAERQEIERFLPPRRARALLAEAEQALRERRADARRRALDVVLLSGVKPATRIAALATALAPEAAARRLERREAKTGVSGLKRAAPRA